MLHLRLKKRMKILRNYFAGDKVLLTSTDFAWDHGEVRTIKSITGPFSFTLTRKKNGHFTLLK